MVKDEGPHGLIEGHFAKANHHWQALAGRETLVIFPGPHSYVSPTLYVEELSVPTWNYIAVHAYGTMELVEDEPGKEALLAGLIRCRRCGRKLTLRYTGAKHDIPRYSCHRGLLDQGEPRCIAFGGLRVDDAIEEALLRVVEPAAIAASASAASAPLATMAMPLAAGR